MPNSVSTISESDDLLPSQISPVPEIRSLYQNKITPEIKALWARNAWDASVAVTTLQKIPEERRTSGQKRNLEMYLQALKGAEAKGIRDEDYHPQIPPNFTDEQAEFYIAARRRLIGIECQLAGIEPTALTTGEEMSMKEARETIKLFDRLTRPSQEPEEPEFSIAA